MENLQFETDENKFECVECRRLIKVRYIQDTRTITCGCGTEYLVARNPSGLGLIITVMTESQADITTQEEELLEDEYLEDEY